MASPWDDYLRELETRDDPDRRRLQFKGRRRILGGGGGLGVTSVLAAGQNTPVNAGPINFTVTFSAPVTGFTAADVNFGGSTVGGTLLATVTGTGPSYNVAVSGMTGDGTVMVNIPAGAANAVTGGAPNPQSMAAFVTFDTTRPSVTIVPAVGQPDPAGVSPITFTVQFTEPVIGFIASDVVITGTAGGTKTPSLSGGPQTYSVEITGMTTAGTVVANVPANAAQDAAGNLSLAAAAPATVNWVAIAATTTAVTSDTNPSILGSSVTFTATITTTGTPTGTVQFFDGASPLGSPQTVSAGVATLSTSALALGTHSITAQYSGDATHTGSTSSALSQVVNPVVVGTDGQLDFSLAAQSGLQTLVLLEDI